MNIDALHKALGGGIITGYLDKAELCHWEFDGEFKCRYGTAHCETDRYVLVYKLPSHRKNLVRHLASKAAQSVNFKIIDKTLDISKNSALI